METPAPFVFDAAHLTALARAHRDGFAGAEPFPHVVIDDFLPQDVVARLVDEFPTPEAGTWTHHNRASEREKFQLGDEASMPPLIRQVVWALNSGVFLRFLTELTGIEGLITDPMMWGGGLHQTVSGGRLGIHADFHRHPVMDLDRRLNAIVFLNPSWRPEWGGALELWARDMSCCVGRVVPILNRCVIFCTTDWSYHGHPEPVVCPDGVSRRSLALYYYTNGRPATEVMARWNTTLFRRRPGTQEADDLLGTRLKHVAWQCIPPIVIDLKRALFGRRSAKTKSR